MPEESSAAERKRQLVVAAFAGLCVSVAATVSAEQTLGYRSKATFVAKTLATGTILGAYRSGTHFVLDLHGCVIEEAPIQRAANWLRAQVRDVEAYDERSAKGSLRYVLMRSSSQGEVLVTLIGPSGPPRWARALALRMLAALPFVRGVGWSLNADKGNALLRADVTTLAGVGHVEEQIDGLRFRLSAQSFFQVHRQQASRLRDAMMEALGDVRERQVWDLFCGAGANALRLAKAGARVHGIESVPAAVRDAISNAKNNELNSFFMVHDLDASLPAGLPHPDAVVLNPPRRGASSALIAALARLQPAKIIYIACAPKPVAAATKSLISAGYVVERVIPFDLFPHTQHVETLAVFTRQNSL